MKKIAILGSTGSIGTSCLEVIDRFPQEFKVTCLSAHRNINLLYQQALKYRPQAVIITGREEITELEEKLQAKGIRVFWGQKGLVEALKRDEGELVVNALVGAAGLTPTMEAINRGKNIALANKETLVMAGQIIMSMTEEKGISLIPIDSEHSAIFQILLGEERDKIRRLILTASGGPFVDRDPYEFDDITIEEALAHPNWDMGKKISIDSATLMNKGLEVIEAHWLFGIAYDKIEVVIHPQSIVHSMVEFVDGSVKAQLGIPDMKVPIQFALTYPHRRPSDFGCLNFAELRQLTFSAPDLRKFPCLALAFKAIEMGETAPAVLSAANEVAVNLFLEGKIRFSEIAKLIERTLSHHKVVGSPTIEQIVVADQWARNFVAGSVGGLSRVRVAQRRKT